MMAMVMALGETLLITKQGIARWFQKMKHNRFLKYLIYLSINPLTD